VIAIMEFILAHPGRLERPTCGFEVRRSIQLSYGCNLFDGIRFTCNFQVQNYPTLPPMFGCWQDFTFQLILLKRLHVEDGPQNRAKDRVFAVGVPTVLISAVVSIVIATAKPLAEIVIIFVWRYIVAIIAIVRVLIGIIVFVG
jgi:hypothetical protein